MNKEEANKAFQITVEAINLSLSGKFPVGLDHIELHVQVKAALTTLSEVMKEHFEECEDCGCSEQEVVTAEG